MDDGCLCHRSSCNAKNNKGQAEPGDSLNKRRKVVLFNVRHSLCFSLPLFLFEKSKNQCMFVKGDDILRIQNPCYVWEGAQSSAWGSMLLSFLEMIKDEQKPSVPLREATVLGRAKTIRRPHHFSIFNTINLLFLIRC